MNSQPEKKLDGLTRQFKLPYQTLEEARNFSKSRQNDNQREDSVYNSPRRKRGRLSPGGWVGSGIVSGGKELLAIGQLDVRCSSQFGLVQHFYNKSVGRDVVRLDNHGQVAFLF